jgi:hypothetical protein
MKSINIISVDNGAGLSTDARIIKSCLTDWQINFIDIHKRDKRPKADINLFLEVLSEKEYLFDLAPINLIIPNPEWFAQKWILKLPSINYILCKTKHCKSVFDYKGQHNKTVYTSFTSEDKFDESIPRKRAYFHLAGHSQMKSSDKVYKSFEQLKTPYLIGISKHFDYKNTSNIQWVKSTVSSEELNRLQNTCAIHVCPSQYEGFGHYINEARSCGAFIISTNEAPMNELIHPSYALGCASRKSSIHNMVALNDVSQESIQAAVSQTMSMTDMAILNAMDASRQAFLDNDKLFRNTFTQFINGL